MSDYISRQAAIEAVDECTKLKITDDFYTVYTEEMKDVIADIPAADVVEVVRCKDCKHYKRNIPCVGGHYNGCDEWIDEGNPITVYDNDYCSYGERRQT